MAHATAALRIGILLALAGCDGKADAVPRGSRPDRRFPVELEAVESRRIEVTVTAVGSLEAFEVVQVTARVAGVVDQVVFAEGDEVAPGTVLVEIEPRRFRLAVAETAAAHEHAQAAEAEAQQALARREQMAGEGVGIVSGEELEQHRSRARLAAAETARTRAALERARLDARDARVVAPVGGLLQTKTVQTGQYVQPGTVLATLVRRDPLLLRFTVPETDAARLTPGLGASFRLSGRSTPFRAVLSHVAESADEQTRMVPVTARVETSGDPALRPGAFAEVTIAIGEPHEATVVPQTAVRPSERGFVAFVVEGELARERILELGLRTADGLVEVRRGVRAGEQLVVRGAEALRDGAHVRAGPEPRARR